jgi:hypothetical protein
MIGWPIERLLLHLNEAKDELAVLSPSAELRSKVADELANELGMRTVDRPEFSTAGQLWPPEYTTWLALSSTSGDGARPAGRTGGLPYAAAAFPKLTILLDAGGDEARQTRAEWSRIVRQPGRGPTLRLQTVQWAEIQPEILAAIWSVWPDLGPNSGSRLQ